MAKIFISGSIVPCGSHIVPTASHMESSRHRKEKSNSIANSLASNKSCYETADRVSPELAVTAAIQAEHHMSPGRRVWLCPAPTNGKFDDDEMLGGLWIGDMKRSRGTREAIFCDIAIFTVPNPLSPKSSAYSLVARAARVSDIGVSPVNHQCLEQRVLAGSATSSFF
jgi:hypothetical protein